MMFYSFRWVRAQELGAMVNCILLISLCFTILIQAVKRLITIEPIDREKLPIYITVGIIGLCINIIALLVLGGDLTHGHSHGGKRHEHSCLHTNDCEAPDTEETNKTITTTTTEKKKKKYGCRFHQ